MEELFECRIVDEAGRSRKVVVRAASEAEALARENRRGARVIAIARLPQAAARTGTIASPRERIDLLRQLAVMTEARIEMSQILQAMQAGTPNARLKDSLGHGLMQLRSGLELADCVDAAIPGLDVSTLALVRAGEAGGCLAETFSHAVSRLEAEERVRTALRSSLVYPAFLVVAGLVAAFVILTFVIPRFAAVAAGGGQAADGLSGLVFSLGAWASQTYGLGLLVPAALAGAALAALVMRPVSPVRDFAVARLPVLKALIRERERERWCRLMTFALAARIGIIEAMELASAGLVLPASRTHAKEAIRLLRKGVAVVTAIEKAELLDPSQLGLVRAGEETGTLAQMFERIACASEERIQEQIKRATVLLEQCVILAVSLFVGLIVYALLSSLTSVYETIGQ